MKIQSNLLRWGAALDEAAAAGGADAAAVCGVRSG